MWSYVKRLEYPVNIKNPNPAAAKVILDALGGHLAVRRPGRRARRVAAVSEPALRHAVSRAERAFNGHR